MAGAGADEGNLRGTDTRHAAVKSGDDFVGKLMSEFADLRVGGIAAIDFADDGFVGGAADVVTPGGDDDFSGGFGEIAKGDKIGIEGRIGPCEFLKFLRLRGNGGGIKAGRDEIHDAGEGEIVADDLGEEAGVRFGGVDARGKISDGDARFFDAEAGAGAEPILGKGWESKEEKKESGEWRVASDETEDLRQRDLPRKLG